MSIYFENERDILSSEFEEVPDVCDECKRKLTMPIIIEYIGEFNYRAICQSCAFDKSMELLFDCYTSETDDVTTRCELPPGNKRKNMLNPLVWAAKLFVMKQNASKRRDRSLKKSKEGDPFTPLDETSMHPEWENVGLRDDVGRPVLYKLDKLSSNIVGVQLFGPAKMRDYIIEILQGENGYDLVLYNDKHTTMNCKDQDDFVDPVMLCSVKTIRDCKNLILNLCRIASQSSISMICTCCGHRVDINLRCLFPMEVAFEDKASFICGECGYVYEISIDISGDKSAEYNCKKHIS